MFDARLVSQIDRMCIVDIYELFYEYLLYLDPLYFLQGQGGQANGQNGSTKILDNLDKSSGKHRTFCLSDTSFVLIRLAICHPFKWEKIKPGCQ